MESKVRKALTWKRSFILEKTNYVDSSSIWAAEKKCIRKLALLLDRYLPVRDFACTSSSVLLGFARAMMAL